MRSARECNGHAGATAGEREERRGGVDQARRADFARAFTPRAFIRPCKGGRDAPMIGKLNHVGIATPSIEDSWKLYRDVLGATSVTEKRALPEQGVWVSFVILPNAQIELIEPYGDASPITAFLEKNPRGGQHHVCFEVPDILRARDEMRAKGATVLGNGEPRIGAHGVPVIFMHPKDMGGVLVELMAEPQEAH
jgi:methylmalonyl-CoA/ethylmalonyl-CoA epimerase